MHMNIREERITSQEPVEEEPIEDENNNEELLNTNDTPVEEVPNE